MMAITLAYDGREVGGFFAFPDKRDVGETTRDLAFSHFLGAADSSGKSSMGGTLHADWLCDERSLDFEGHQILNCKFTFAPNLSAKTKLNDQYKRLPTNVTQKMRKPHSDQVFGGCFGRCLHFVETNMAPGMVQMEDILDYIVKRTICVLLSSGGHLRETQKMWARIEVSS